MTIRRNKLNGHKAEMAIKLIKMNLAVKKIDICTYF